MRAYWEIIVEPLLNAVRPTRIVEIGVDHGDTTVELLRYADARGGVLEAIDPRPMIEVDEWLATHGQTLCFHRGLSLEVLPELAPAELVVIDGDHNWYTVRHELQILESTALAAKVEPPVIVLHDVGWPYGRRDLYYRADDVPEQYRNDHMLGGLVLGSGIVEPEAGLNAHLDHAVEEGGARNGVLTAIEDFLTASRCGWHLAVVHGLNGLALLVPRPTLADNGRLRDFVEALGSEEFLVSLVQTVEAVRLDAEIRRQDAVRRLARVSSASQNSPTAENRDQRETIRALREELDDARNSMRIDRRRRLTAEKRDEKLSIALADLRRELRDSASRCEDLERRCHVLEQESAAAVEAERQRLGIELAARESELDEMGQVHAQLVSDTEVDRERIEGLGRELARRLADSQRTAAELRERIETHELGSDGYELQVALLREALAAARIAAEGVPDPRGAKLSETHDVSVADGRAGAAARPVQTPEFTAEADREGLARAMFFADYACGPAPLGAPRDVDALALPAADDRRSTVVSEHSSDGSGRGVDVVVCVHNALDDVRRCLWSLLHKTDSPYRLVVVDDASDEPTALYLRSVASAIPAMHLRRVDGAPRGYAVAANIGLRMAKGEYVVLLNSDTIVTPGWLDRMVACGESDPAVGVLGPLSNAATHQSIPELRSAGEWATNPLPVWASADAISKLLERVSPRERPRVPFINGFCYVIKRSVIDAIGYFDEDRFASGYGEENDYSIRARDAGFQLAVVDDAYVFHAKSRSFTPARRKVLATSNYEKLLAKHGSQRVQTLVRELESNTKLAALRRVIGERLSSMPDLASGLDIARYDPLRIVFILPGLGRGGSGGSHSIYQEVQGLRQLGLDAHIAIDARALDRARRAYDDVEVFRAFADHDELAEITGNADVISATHFKSIALLARLRTMRDDFLPAYYVQDYEPYFTTKQSSDYAEALASYGLIDDCVLFAKTHWLCNVIGERHGLHVAKVEASVDERLFHPRDRPAGGPLRVTAMLRPRTPRRQPRVTIAVLEELVARLGDGVVVRTFGCDHAELAPLTSSDTVLAGHRGLLHRRDVADLFGSTDVFLDMSIYQAFGRASLEAMACGATTIVPRLGGAWEFVEQRANAIAVDTRDPHAAVAAMLELSSDERLLRRLRDEAVRTGARYSILKASLSEYLLFSREHARRFGTHSTRDNSLEPERQGAT